jgi:hypothetical protein
MIEDPVPLVFGCSNRLDILRRSGRLGTCYGPGKFPDRLDDILQFRLRDVNDETVAILTSLR